MVAEIKSASREGGVGSCGLDFESATAVRIRRARRCVWAAMLRTRWWIQNLSYVSDRRPDLMHGISQISTGVCHTYRMMSAFAAGAEDVFTRPRAEDDDTSASRSNGPRRMCACHTAMPPIGHVSQRGRATVCRLCYSLRNS